MIMWRILVFMALLLLNSPVQRPCHPLYSRKSAKSLGKFVISDRNGDQPMTLDPRIIQCEATVAAPIQAVWDAWTTNEGASTFFAPQANISAQPGGPYEIFFNPDAPKGTRGAEGMLVLAVQEPLFLSFTWNAPPHLPTVRGQYTHVEIRLQSISENSTHVTLEHGGWGTGGEWESAFDYFVRAWGKVVLPRLVQRFESGPIDWNNPTST